MCGVFTDRLRNMDAQSKANIAKALTTATEPAIVRSAFDLPPAQRSALQKVLNETFSAEVHVDFESAPNLVSGIEFVTNGQKISWSISEYLGVLEKGVSEVLNRNNAPPAKDAAAPDTEPEPKEAAKAAPKPDTPKSGLESHEHAA
jgi:F-type H+-transporting ATPase subunit b